MAEVLLFHHVHGLTPGVLGFADDLRRAGHGVHAPDLFDGRTFERLDDGLAFVRQTGFAQLIARGVRAADARDAAALLTQRVLDFLAAR